MESRKMCFLEVDQWFLAGLRDSENILSLMAVTDTFLFLASIAALSVVIYFFWFSANKWFVFGFALVNSLKVEENWLVGDWSTAR